MDLKLPKKVLSLILLIFNPSQDGFDCFFFHDVDLVPENDHNIYECFDNPRHYSGYIDKFNYNLPYNSIFGGITAYSAEAFEKINGYRLVELFSKQ